eukprot:TRINITY_DN2503_c0_g1_i1.p1 TRINITY_DN2503_c0_g1~~TRINITY_DN2503_c0_g1_i1.p1  ORF type:complete len:203 (-),score=33.41 TRINITY_DN2503_c0_g1_i1:89-697(-)
MMSDNHPSDSFPSPSSFWDNSGTGKCPRAPITGPKIPLIVPDDLVLPPPQKRPNAHSREVRMLSEPMPIFHTINNDVGSSMSIGIPEFDLDTVSSSVSSSNGSFIRFSGDFSSGFFSSPPMSVLQPPHQPYHNNNHGGAEFPIMSTPALGAGNRQFEDLAVIEKDFMHQMGNDNSGDAMSVDEDQGATTIFQMIVESSTMDS